MSFQEKKTAIEIFVIDRAREMRMKKNMSQVELGNVLGISSGFIGNVESPNHAAKYNLNHINQLAEIFECSPKDFLPQEHF